MKKSILFSALTLTFFIAGNALAAENISLGSLNPSNGIPGDKIQAQGWSYEKGSKIVFSYEESGSSRVKSKSVSANPVIKTLISTVKGLPQRMNTEFEFKVPSLPMGVYKVRLEHKELGASNAVSFTILPTVSSSSPKSGGPTTRITVSGKGFSWSAANNSVMLKNESTGETVSGITSPVPIKIEKANTAKATTDKLYFTPSSAMKPGKYTVEVYTNLDGQWVQAGKKSAPLTFTVKEQKIKK